APDTFIVHPDQFPGFYVTQEFSPKRIDRHALGRHDVPVLDLSQAERFDTKGIAERVDDAIDHDHDRVRALHSFHAEVDCILHTARCADLVYEDLCNDLRIGGGGKDLACLFVLPPELAGVDQVPVMGDRDEMILELEIQGLYILRQVCTGCRVPHMADTGRAFKIF